MSLRVMIDARYLGPASSGIGRYTENVIDHLLEIDDALRLELVTHSGVIPEAATRHPDRVGLQHYDAEPNSLRTRFAMVRSLDFAGIDLFHSPFNILPGGLPCPAVFTLHDIMWLLDASFCTDVLWRKLVTGTFYKQMIPRSVADASRILTVSHHSRESIEEYFPGTEGRVHVSYNAVDPFFYPVDPDDPDEGWGAISEVVPRDTPFALIVGQASPYKNHPGAVAGFLEAFRDQPDVHLVMVRRLSRTTDERMNDLLADPALAGRVHQLSHVSGAQLRALYGLARFFLFPSLYEGFGLPALEAMACGTPVVTSNFGAMAEVGADAALKVDPRDPNAIAQALHELQDDDVWSERRAAGLARAAEFTWESCARSVLETYRLASS